MPSKTDDRWPDWGKPATKGDVVRALVGTRSCIVDIYICLNALARQDMDRFKESLKELEKSDKELQELLDEIGGAPKSG
jgi:hypothetical protein